MFKLTLFFLDFSTNIITIPRENPKVRFSYVLSWGIIVELKDLALAMSIHVCEAWEHLSCGGGGGTALFQLEKFLIAQIDHQTPGPQPNHDEAHRSNDICPGLSHIHTLPFQMGSVI